MKANLKRFFLFFFWAYLLFLFGCVGVKYQRVDQYLLQVKTPTQERSIAKKIKVQHVVINQQFSDINFVYRDSNIHYLIDYYNGFLVAPAIQIQQVIEQYLNDTHLFRYVVDEGSFDYVDYTLTAKVLELYADYRDTSSPKAVMTIQFVLANPNTEKNKILFNKTLTQPIPLARKDTQSLVNGWNRGLTLILRQLTREILKSLS